MKYKTEARFSSGLIIRTVFRYVVRAMGWSFYAALGVSASAALYLYFTGNRTILLPVFTGVTVLGILIFLRMYAHYFTGVNRDFRKLESPVLQVFLKENGISFNGQTDSIRWKDLVKAWSTAEAYLFFTSKDSFVIFPRGGLDSEAEKYIEDRLDEFRVNRQ